MQTFLPYKDFVKTAQTLDYRRLGKQRVEAFQILKAMERTSGGWINHPATRMWRNHKDALGHYMNVMIDEWISRGYKNTMQKVIVPKNPELPPWLGGSIHSTHRAALLYKNFSFYERFQWKEAPKLDYFWPV